MKTLTIMIIILFNILFALDFKTAKPKPAYIPEGIFTDVDWEGMTKQFIITGKVKFCKPKDASQGFIGLKAELIEPYLIAETVKKPYYFKMMEQELDSSNSLITKSGKSSEGGFKYLHVMQFPIMAIIAKQANIDFKGLFYFASPRVTLRYMSELDPLAHKDFLKIKTLPEFLPFITPQGIAGGIVDCISAMTMYYTMNNNDLDKNRYSKDIRDGIFYANGCTGLMAVGTANDQQENPFTTSLNIIMGHLYDYMKLKYYRQSVYSVLNPSKSEIWCHTEDGLPIKWQFVPQLVRPLTGKMFEMGTTPAIWSTFKRDGSSGGDAVFLIWKRRDYAAFAYQGGD